MAKKSTGKLCAAILFVCISATWRQDLLMESLLDVVEKFIILHFLIIKYSLLYRAECRYNICLKSLQYFILIFIDIITKIGKTLDILF